MILEKLSVMFDRLMVDRRDLAQRLDMIEIFMIDNVGLSDHAEILDGQSGDLPLSEFVHAGALRQDGNAEIFSDQILDRRDVVHFEGDVKTVDRLINAREGGLK